MNRNRSWKFYKALKVLAIAAIAITAFGYGTQQLWNWLIPGIFGLHTITFAQAIGLVALSKILFGGFGGRGGPGRNRWKEGMRERWEHMTPEERDRFRSGMRGRRNWCSDWSDRTSPKTAEQVATEKGL